VDELFTRQPGVLEELRLWNQKRRENIPGGFQDLKTEEAGDDTTVRALCTTLTSRFDEINDHSERTKKRLNDLNIQLKRLRDLRKKC
jgi:hypothetical protein